MTSNKGKAGRKQSDVWDFFEKESLKSAGHFSAKCNFCHKNWPRAYVNGLQNHLANECDSCPDDIQNYWLEFIVEKDSLDDMIAKRRKVTVQTGIDDYFEGRELPKSKITAINQALIRAFVCCGISFSIIENPFFIELLHQLRPNYNPPNRRVLSESLLNQETARVNKIIKKELDNSTNLTLGKLVFYNIILFFIF
jgi:hypothetical protein